MADELKSAGPVEWNAVRRVSRGGLDAIVGVDTDGAIVLVNTRAGSLISYSRNELLGRPADILVPDGVRGVHPAHRASHLRNPQRRPMGAGMELAGGRMDGRESRAEISLASIEFDGRRIVSAAIRDVSERKRAEAKFRGLLEAAARTVSQRRGSAHSSGCKCV
ncbi:MAG: PAS domain S-box protein [Candidatus Dormiibacterota bacterium]